MNRNNDFSQEENEHFSLEDIIAEVKADSKGYIPKGEAIPTVKEPAEEEPEPHEPDMEAIEEEIPVFGSVGFDPPPRKEKQETPSEPLVSAPENNEEEHEDGEDEEEENVRVAEFPFPKSEVKKDSGSGPQVIDDVPGRRVILFKKKKQEKAPEKEEPEINMPSYPVSDDEDYYLSEEEYEDEEEEKEEIPYDFLNLPFDDCAKAVKRLGKKLRGMSARLVFIFLLLVLSGVLTFGQEAGLPVPENLGGLPTEFVKNAALTVCGFLSLIFCWEVFTAGLWRLFKLRPTLDSLTVFSSMCAVIHSGLSAFKICGGESLCFVTCLCCFSALAAKRRRAANLRRVYKCMSMSADPAAIKIMGGKKTRAAFKTHTAAVPDTEDIASRDMTEKISLVFAPLAIVASVVLAGVAAFGAAEGSSFMNALAVISAVAAPCAMTMSSVRPWGKASKKIFSSGAAVLNYGSAVKLSRVKRAAVEDGDIFPLGSVRIAGMKITSSHVSLEQAVADAAAVMKSVGGGAAKAFGDFAREQYLAPRKALDVRYYHGGGISARVRDDYVLMGTAAFIKSMGVNLHEVSEKKDAVFLAVNSYEAAIFTLKYDVSSQSFTAFGILSRLGITADLAVKDFGVTESLIERRFAVKKSLVSIPPQEVKNAYWSGEPASEEPPCAILIRDSFLSMAETLSAAKNIVRSVRINIFCALACSIIGMITMYFLAAVGKIYLASPANIALYLIVWYLPVWFTGAFMTKS